MSRNYYQIITNYFIKELEQGIIPWRRSTSVPFHGFAQNYYSGRVYRGINWFLLNLVTAHEIPYYLTKNQTVKLGGSVLEGTKPYGVFSFRTYYKSSSGKRLAMVHAKHLETEKDASVQRISFWIRHSVFHVSQTQNVTIKNPVSLFPKTAKALLEQMPQQPTIKYYELDECYYDPRADEIIFPHTNKGAGDDPYLLFVNLINWTGHKGRLSRPGIANTPSDGNYNVEEQFIADIGASFLCRMIGQPIPFQIQKGQATDILTLWIQTLEEDNRFLFRVASQVQRAVEYLLRANHELVL